MKGKLVFAVGLEIAYALITRWWLPSVTFGIELELWITAFRILTALAFILLFREVIFCRVSCLSGTLHPLFILGFLGLLLEPLLSGNWGLPDTATKSVFAFTSIAVAVHEEIVYRGVLQNLLERRTTKYISIVLSSIVFVIYHYGVQSFNPANVVMLFAVGCLLGLVYSVTGSLMLVIAIHAVVDGIWAFSPFLSSPLPQNVAVMFALLSLLVIVGWEFSINRSDK